MDSRDDKQPYTDSWSVTVAQRTPWQGLLEVAYVGNRSRDLPSSGGFGSNLNLVPVGAMLSAVNPGNADSKFYRPLNNPSTGKGYGDLNQATNNLYADYKAMQVTWGRHLGRYTIQANYTLQKAMGILSANANGQPNGSASINPFNLQSNYGVQPTDRRHLFNIAYSIDIGNPLHAHGFLSGVTSGWQISGITQVQSGANVTYSVQPDLLLRAGVARVMSRPGYAQLAGAFTLNDTIFTGTTGGNQAEGERAEARNTGSVCTQRQPSGRLSSGPVRESEHADN